MAMNYASFAGDNFGSPAAGPVYGPYNLGSCSKLLRVEAWIGTTPIETGTWANNFVQDFAGIWGVQWVPHGDSPLTLPAYAFDQQFLWVSGLPDAGFSNFSWGSTTDPGSLSTGSVGHNLWRGQRPINQDIDIYATVGASTGSPSDSQGAVLIRVINTT